MEEPPLVRENSFTHLYTLKIGRNNTFEVHVDKELELKGNLLETFKPKVNPPKMIDDPSDKKPSTWVDDPLMDDPNAVKPEKWDESQPEFIPDPNDKIPDNWLENESLYIPDPHASIPADWDSDFDGEWVAPTIPNPKCQEFSNCGRWSPRLIKNPNYFGKWKPSKIQNPNYIGIYSFLIFLKFYLFFFF